MIFLGWLQELVALIFEGRVNHYPLLQLIIFSLDKTLIYLGCYLLGRWLWLKYVKGQSFGQTNWWRESLIFISLAYALMLIHLTVLRYDWQWWQLTWYVDRSWSDFHWLPLVDTVKLLDGDSRFSYWYNFFGNVLWFIPLGFLWPLFSKRRHLMFSTLTFGLAVSCLIEILQFYFYTGVSHVDDIIFNCAGTVLGYLLYDLGQLVISYQKEH
ncbi:hypothetical protein AWM75_05285 [Aerococcus urinaehominis]|uniref:VanZ-like domain-containing protein n=1 Tax=Aerococcus urinaehominis TaxID=128944 RepID=A0A0X8FMM0_9LACT|nr:VanZ family protein [Aerococcus urinaehominis]AMB99442.1 hypothetical protein AWM75_05285 [Aerococcus urinaehominis]SDM28846.1 Glycopeptide antibiotics resistance protein [Aerococcus urinaehominis]